MSTAIRTALKVVRTAQILENRRPSNNRNLLVFEMGPSVKFVSAIKDAILQQQKNGVNIFPGKKPYRGSEGEMVKDHTFPHNFFSVPFPKPD